MKLSSAQGMDVVKQLETSVIPSDHPAVPQLVRTFGEHTFFLGREGLHVVKRGEVEAGPTDDAYAVRVASWSDNSKTKLVPHPGTIAQIVDIGPPDADLGNSGADAPFETTAKSDE